MEIKRGRCFKGGYILKNVNNITKENLRIINSFIDKYEQITCSFDLVVRLYTTGDTLLGSAPTISYPDDLPLSTVNLGELAAATPTFELRFFIQNPMSSNGILNVTNLSTSGLGVNSVDNNLLPLAISNGTPETEIGTILLSEAEDGDSFTFNATVETDCVELQIEYTFIG